MIYFFNDHTHHLKKDDKVAATVSIDETKNTEFTIVNEQYWHFVVCSHTNHYISFTEDVSDGAKKRNKLEELNDEVKFKKIKVSAETKITTA